MNVQPWIPFTRHGFLLAAMLLAVLASSLFLPGLGGGFLLDDGPNIQKNYLLHLSRLDPTELIYASLSFGEQGGRRALSMLSFALDYWRGGGLDAPTFKTTNLLVHACTVLALALFFRRLLPLAGWTPSRTATAALVLALIWAIHPLQVSSVLYVVQRMQTLCTLFVVLALWAYLGMRQAQMEGRPSRKHDLLLLLFLALALASKEDAALLPAYTLALELSVLRFRAATPKLGNTLRKGYLALGIAAAAVYVLVIVPRYWHWDAYPWRVFSSAERLLTQGRVLVMYLGEILFPLPSMMPFNYDDLSVSRGPFQPWTTLPAWLLILALLWLAWRLRHRRPLLALGIMLFFSGHIITSNVIGLELAFEHRNHFPLIGIVLAVADACAAIGKRWAIRPQWIAATLTGLIVCLGTATISRAHAWGEPVRFAKYSVALAPHSPRAWLMLAGAYIDLSHWKADSPYLTQAINTLEEGARHVDSPTFLSNLVLYKTIQGNATGEDWQRLHAALQRAPKTVQARSIVPTLLNNLRLGIPLDQEGALGTFEIVRARQWLGRRECLQIGYFLLYRHARPETSLPYLRCVVSLSPPNDPLIVRLLAQLQASGHGDWARQLQQPAFPLSEP